MKKMKKVLTILFTAIILCSLQVRATTYYLSGSGNDNNPGKSAEQSWKTIDRLNKAILKLGDSVLFHAGQSFIGTIQVRQSGTIKKPIVFSTYGDGPKTIISGAYKIDNFQPESENIYAAKVDETIKHIYCNNQIMTIARYPNKEVLTMEGGDKQHLIEENKPFSDEVLVGATARLRHKIFDTKYGLLNKVFCNIIKKGGMEFEMKSIIFYFMGCWGLR